MIGSIIIGTLNLVFTSHCVIRFRRDYLLSSLTTMNPKLLFLKNSTGLLVTYHFEPLHGLQKLSMMNLLPFQLPGGFFPMAFLPQLLEPIVKFVRMGDSVRLVPHLYTWFLILLNLGKDLPSEINILITNEVYSGFFLS